MKRFKNTFGIAVILGLILTQFNNCGEYQSQAGVSVASSLSCFEADNCFDSDQNKLELQITTENDISLGQSQWINVSGVCNEGAFPINEVRWNMYDSRGDQVIGPSQLAWDYKHPAHGDPLQGKCEQGRFSLLVHFPNLGITAQHKVQVELVAFDEEGNEYRNSTLAKKDIYIIP